MGGAGREGGGIGPAGIGPGAGIGLGAGAGGGGGGGGRAVSSLDGAVGVGQAAGQPFYNPFDVHHRQATSAHHHGHHGQHGHHHGGAVQTQ